MESGVAHSLHKGYHVALKWVELESGYVASYAICSGFGLSRNWHHLKGSIFPTRDQATDNARAIALRVVDAYVST